MLRILRLSRAQTTLEYAILFGVIVAGLIAMQVYLKRGWQGKLRDSSDSMGEQFSPAHTTYNYTTTSKSKSQEKSTYGSSHTDVNYQNTSRNGSENVSNENQEKWWN